MKAKKGMISREWFVTVFLLINVIIISVFGFNLVTTGPKKISQVIVNEQLVTQADEELRIFLQQKIRGGILPLTTLQNELIKKDATIAELIDRMGYDISNRERCFDILHYQTYSYFDLLGNPLQYRLKVSYTQKPSGEFKLPTAYSVCYDADFCVLPNEPHGETIVGELNYPSVNRNQIITVRLIKKK